MQKISVPCRVDEELPPVTVGLIGLGNVGAIHYQAYRAHPSLRIVGVADPDPARRAMVEKSIPQYDRFEDLLQEQRPQIACVLTPVATHEAVVRSCAAAGTHVFCEKPLANSVASAERMIAACASAGTRLFYGSCYRYLPALIEARRLIADGAIGRIRLVTEQHIAGRGATMQRAMSNAHYPDGTPGGSGMGLVDHGVHLIDVFGWLIGDRIARAGGRGNLSGEPLGVEFATLSFEGGAIGSLLYDEGTYSLNLPTAGLFSWGGSWDATGFKPGGSWDANPGSICVYGERGALRIFHYANVLVLSDESGMRQIPLAPSPSPQHFVAQLEDFARSVALDRPVAISGEAGLEALRVLEAIYASKAGHPVPIERDSER